MSFIILIYVVKTIITKMDGNPFPLFTYIDACMVD